MTAEKRGRSTSPEIEKPKLEISKSVRNSAPKKIEIKPSPTKKEMEIEKYQLMVKNVLHEIADILKEITNLPDLGELTSETTAKEQEFEKAKTKAEGAWFRKKSLQRNADDLGEKLKDLKKIQNALHDKTIFLESTFAGKKRVLDSYLRFYADILEINEVDSTQRIETEFPFLKIIGSPSDESFECVFFKADYPKIISAYEKKST